MDGLLLDTEAPAISAWVRAASALGFEADPEIPRRTIGVDAASTRAIVLEALGPDFPYEEVRGVMRRIIREEAARNGIPQKPGIAPLLDHLAARGIPGAIATSTARELAEWKLERSGLAGRFPVMVCGDEVERGKPAPDIFLKAAEKLSTPPEQCIGFEDSPAGIRALHAAGIKSVFIKDLVEPPPPVLALVWRRLDRLDEAIPLIG
jgi:HAD superfamily hydrolase (TIGR01509 family)